MNLLLLAILLVSLQYATVTVHGQASWYTAAFRPKYFKYIPALRRLSGINKELDKLFFMRAYLLKKTDACQRSRSRHCDRAFRDLNAINGEIENKEIRRPGFLTFLSRFTNLEKDKLDELNKRIRDDRRRLIQNPHRLRALIRERSLLLWILWETSPIYLGRP